MSLGLPSAVLAALVSVVSYVAWTATVDAGAWGWIAGGAFWLGVLLLLLASLAALARRALGRGRAAR